jgi:hypothetical protein
MFGDAGGPCGECDRKHCCKESEFFCGPRAVVTIGPGAYRAVRKECICRGQFD